MQYISLSCTFSFVFSVNGSESIDWEFVKEIQSEGDPRPVPPQDDARKKFQFQHDLYEDAVVMPWYRNQDQPQVCYDAYPCVMKGMT